MAKTATKAKTKAADIEVPQTREELAACVRSIGESQRARERLKGEFNGEVALLKAQDESAVAPYLAREEQLVAGAQTFCEANRKALTQDGKVKHFDTGAGKVECCQRPPSVRLNNGWSAEAVIEALKSMRLFGFIRIKEELNREAILAAEPAQRARIEGVRVASGGEDFIVTPIELELGESK